MSDDKRNGSIKWIIALCLTATLAIVGWTVTGTLSTRGETITDLANQANEVRANVMANNVRLSVLESKYDTIQATLTEIKVLLQKHMER